MKWIDVQEIAIQLADTYSEIDPLSVRFTDLMHWVMALPDFEDTPGKCNEKILEAIQMAWLDEQN
ncbi:MAG: Fe-S cluster assembly protein IscX [Magnetococcus sp. DMHC-6]